MNREIKFRAYHSKHGWLYFVIQPTPENRDQTISFGSAIGRQMLQEGLTWWGQFVGLKDKNGGEIYEGDILHSDFHGEDGLSHNFVVEYKAATGFIGGQTSGQNPRYCTTVIGNIYENPALLKDAAPNTQCTSACGNDYDCPHEDDSETEDMTRLEQLDLIRAACIEANPSDTTLRDQHSWQGLQIRRNDGRPVRLADVLLAIGSGVRLEEQTSSGELAIGIAGRGWTRWNLRNDLTEQSDECVAFLAELLK